MNLKSPCWRQVYSITCDYIDAYILVSGTITIIGAKKDEATKRLDERIKGVTFKNYSSYISCIGKINNTAMIMLNM